MGLFRDKKLESEIADLREYINDRLDWERKSLEARYPIIADAVNNPRFDQIDERFLKLEDRIEDLEKENCELQVFKDFVEQYIRDTSDSMIAISSYFEELQKVCKNAAELTDGHYENNKLKWISPYEKEPEIGQEIFYKTADGQRHVGYILEKGLKPRKSRWFSDSMDPNDSNDMLDPDETTDEEYRVKEWLDENNAED